MPNELDVTVGNTGSTNIKGTTGDGNADRNILNADESADAESTESDSEDSEAEDKDSEEEEADNKPAEEDDEDSDSSDDDSEEESDDTEKDELEEVDNLYKTIKKTDPQLFKKYPELKQVIARERQYTEIFPNVDDAKFAVNRANLFHHIEKDIMAGNVTPLMETLKGNGNTLSLFAQDFITNLKKVDKNLYGEVAAVPIKDALRFAFAEGKKSGNKNIWASAMNLHDFIFGNHELNADPEFSKKKPDVDPEKENLQKQLQERDDRQFNIFRNDVHEVIGHRANKEIDKSLETLELNNYSKKNIRKDISDEVDAMLRKDVRFQASITSLWRQAQSAGLTSEWKQRLINAVVARAKDMLPNARRKVLAEAGIGSKGIKKDVKRIVPSGSGSSKSGSNIDFSNIDKKRTSDKDILSDDPRRLKLLK